MGKSKPLLIRMIFQLGSEFYDEDGYLINKMEASEIKSFGNKILPSKMVMTPVEEEGKPPYFATNLLNTILISTKHSLANKT